MSESKSEKITFRVQPEVWEWFDGYAEDRDESKSTAPQEHIRNMHEDEVYRSFVEEFSGYDGTFEEFLNDEEISHQVERDEGGLSDYMFNVIRSAQDGSYEEAYSLLEEMEEEGLRIEASLLGSAVNQYRD